MRYHILLSILLFSTTSFAQPTGDEKNYTSVNLAFYNCQGDTIKLIKDKYYNIRSEDSAYTLTSYEILNNSVRKSSIDAYVVDESNGTTFFSQLFQSSIQTLKIIISKNNIKTIVYFRIHQQAPTANLPWKIKMYILLKEGVFEVTDPNNPKLVPIKEE